MLVFTFLYKLTMYNIKTYIKKTKWEGDSIRNALHKYTTGTQYLPIKPLGFTKI